MLEEKEPSRDAADAGQAGRVPQGAEERPAARMMPRLAERGPVGQVLGVEDPVEDEQTEGPEEQREQQGSGPQDIASMRARAS